MIRFIPKREIEFGIQNATKDISITLSENYLSLKGLERKKLERLSPLKCFALLRIIRLHKF